MGVINVSTIKDPEFINLKSTDINPLMSSCEIKVMYLNENRNGSYITKEVATDMAKTLRGCPIVGWFKQEKDDFMDHGEQIIIDGDGVKFNCLTKPYGFVAPDAKIWFQEFEETDSFNNKIIREYLMTEGYLWTEQYSEAKKVIEEGRPHSMELDYNTLQGKWELNPKNGMEFFIISDAVFSKLCILGKDVEPCFEDSSIKGVNNYSNNDFMKDLHSMMKELQHFVLKGENKMVELENKNQKVVTNTNINNDTNNTNNNITNFSNNENNENKENYESLKTNFSELEKKYSSLNKEYEELIKFKKNIEDKQKDELIDSFYMLSDDDKKDIISNKEKYSLDEIESKLSVIGFRKKINFGNLKEENKENKENKENNININKNPEITFNLDNSKIINSIPEWVSATIETQNKIINN